MSQRSTGPIGPPAGDDWPDDLWPADDDVAGRHDDPLAVGGGAAGGKPPLPPGWSAGPGATPRAGRLRPRVLAVVIVVAAAVGAGITALAVHDFSSPATRASAGPGGRPGTVNPEPPGGNGVPGGGAPPGSGTVPGSGNGQAGSMFVLGTVTSVSRTSITIGGPGHTVTAAITSATKITGKVAGIGEIKVGDQVSAQLTRGSGGVTAVAVADPAQAPGGGSGP